MSEGKQALGFAMDSLMMLFGKLMHIDNGARTTIPQNLVRRWRNLGDYKLFENLFKLLEEEKMMEE